jgi:hypothetical protein
MEFLVNNAVDHRIAREYTQQLQESMQIRDAEIRERQHVLWTYRYNELIKASKALHEELERAMKAKKTS